MPIRLKQSVIPLGVCLFLCVFLGVGPVLAEPYGSGGYNNCGYDQRCATTEPAPPAEPTAITLPSGLDVAVNLADGQSIPFAGYIVTVTPLNGQGRTFKSVDFYVDGQLAQAAVTPDTDGTARWQWKPVTEGAVAIKVVVTDTDGTITATKQFAVIIQQQPSQQPAGISTVPTDTAPVTPIHAGTRQSAVGRVVHTIAEGAKQAIRALPRPVAYSFPYILLVLLGINLFVLLLQVKRELGAARILRDQIHQLQVVDEGKKTFMELVSHYFRTPLTILSGGIDMLQPDEIPQAASSQLKTINSNLHGTVEQLISQATDSPTQPVAASQPVSVRYTGALLPVLLIGLILFCFTYVTSRTGNFTVSQLNVAIQVIVYVLLVLASYQVFRRKQLRQRETSLTRQVLSQQESAMRARDNLIGTTALSINNDVRALDGILATLPDTKSVGFIRNGQERFHELAAKFTLVGGLYGGHSQNQPVVTTLGELLTLCQSRIKPALDKRHVRLASAAADIPFAVRDKPLMAYVLSSVLDNATAFSPEQGTVEVAAVPVAPTGTTVTITDHGPGIPVDKQALLFQPFSKATGVQTFDHEGIGLGLYTDKLIMDYVGGAIGLTSKPGQTVVTLQV